MKKARVLPQLDRFQARELEHHLCVRNRYMKARGTAGQAGFAQFAGEIVSSTSTPYKHATFPPMALLFTGQVNARKAQRALIESISPTGRDHHVGHGQFRVPRRRERIYHIKVIDCTGYAHFSLRRIPHFVD